MAGVYRTTGNAHNKPAWTRRGGAYEAVWVAEGWEPGKVNHTDARMPNAQGPLGTGAVLKSPTCGWDGYAA